MSPQNQQPNHPPNIPTEHPNSVDNRDFPYQRVPDNFFGYAAMKKNRWTIIFWVFVLIATVLFGAVLLLQSLYGNRA